MYLFRFSYFITLFVLHISFAQQINMDKRNFTYDFDLIKKSGYELNDNLLIHLVHHGVFKDLIKSNYTEGGVGGIAFTKLKDPKVGKVYETLTNRTIIVQPYFIKPKLDEFKRYRYHFTDDVDMGTFNKLTQELIAYLKDNPRLNPDIKVENAQIIDQSSLVDEVFERYYLGTVERVFKDEIKVQTNDFYIVPLFLRVSNRKNEYFHVELRFYDKGDLLFITSLSALQTPDVFDENYLNENEFLQKRIIDYLFNHVSFN